MNAILRRALALALMPNQAGSGAPAASSPCTGEVRPGLALPGGIPLDSVEMVPVPPGHEHEPDTPKGLKFLDGKCYVREAAWPPLKAALQRVRERAKRVGGA